MKIVKRQEYLEKIRPYVNKPTIKVVTGMRRSGKSFFLKQIIEELPEKKIAKSQIVYINKDSLKKETMAFSHCSIS